MHPLDGIRQYTGKEFTGTPSHFMKWLKPVVIVAEEGRLIFQYQVRKEMTNPMGTLHGGVTAAIVDDLIGATLFSYGEEHFYTTLNIVVDYFSPAREGDVIVAETTLIKKGSQLVNVQCEVRNADRSKLIARGYSNLLKTTIKKNI